MAFLTQIRHDLAADEAGASDDDDLHGLLLRRDLMGGGCPRPHGDTLSRRPISLGFLSKTVRNHTSIAWRQGCAGSPGAPEFHLYQRLDRLTAWTHAARRGERPLAVRLRKVSARFGSEGAHPWIQADCDRATGLRPAGVS